MVGGTFSQVFPVPKVNAASVLPTPVANCPNAPAVPVWLSVAGRISPGRTSRASGRATDEGAACLARIFSVIVMPAGITNSCAGKGGTERSEYSGESAGILTDAAMRRSMQLISLLKSQIGPKPSRQRSSIDLVDR